MLRALWQPRLMEAIRWIEGQESENQAAGRRPIAAEKKGEADIDGVTFFTGRRTASTALKSAE